METNKENPFYGDKEKRRLSNLICRMIPYLDVDYFVDAYNQLHEDLFEEFLRLLKMQFGELYATPLNMMLVLLDVDATLKLSKQALIRQFNPFCAHKVKQFETTFGPKIPSCDQSAFIDIVNMVQNNMQQKLSVIFDENIGQMLEGQDMDNLKEIRHVLHSGVAGWLMNIVGIQCDTPNQSKSSASSESTSPNKSKLLTSTGK